MFGRFASRMGARSVSRTGGWKKAAIGGAIVGALAYGAHKLNERRTPMASFFSTPIAACAAAPLAGNPGTNSERTFIAVKPDGVNRGIVGEIISRFEKKGFKLVALKLIVPTQQLAAGHYDDLKSKPFFPGLVKFFSSGPIVGMVWEGRGAIKTGRVLLGETDPAKSLPGSIRGDFAVDIGRNVCHGSDSPEGANHEINFWFTDKEVFDWAKADASWVYEKPAN